jgi:hypothetical protein
MADLERALRHATLRTFEEMAFAIPIDGPSSSPLPLGAASRPAGQGRDEGSLPTAAAQVTFAGPFTGKVVLAVEEAMLPGLAANMLGVDEAPTAAEQSDALGELTNVLCGNLLPMIAGSQHVFLLDAPTPALEVDSGPPLGRIELALDSGTVLVSLYSDPSVLSLQESRP